MKTRPMDKAGKLVAAHVRIISAVQTAESEMAEPAFAQVFEGRMDDGTIVEQDGGRFETGRDIAQEYHRHPETFQVGCKRWIIQARDHAVASPGFEPFRDFVL